MTKPIIIHRLHVDPRVFEPFELQDGLVRTRFVELINRGGEWALLDDQGNASVSNPADSGPLGATFLFVDRGEFRVL